MYIYIYILYFQSAPDLSLMISRKCNPPQFTPVLPLIPIHPSPFPHVSVQSRPASGLHPPDMLPFKPFPDHEHFEYTSALPQVRVSIPMAKWKSYIRLVIEKCEGCLPTTTSLQLDEKHDQVVQAKIEWGKRSDKRIVANDGNRDVGGRFWSICFQMHESARAVLDSMIQSSKPEMLLEFHSIFYNGRSGGVPSVESMHQALGMISNNLHLQKHFSIDSDSNEELVPEHFSWVDKLTMREADTLGLHMLTYLFVQAPDSNIPCVIVSNFSSH
jgi:hypothetical protein